MAPVVYDELLKVVNFTELPEIIKAVVALDMPRDIEIMDIGCGTGRVGEELVKHGFASIDGVDASKVLLSAVEERGVYRNSHYMYLGSGSFPREEMRDHYDLATSSGVFMDKHIPKEGMTEILECLKPGGMWVFAMRSMYLDPNHEIGYGPAITSLID